MSSAEERKIAEAIIPGSFRAVLSRMLQLLDKFEIGTDPVITEPASLNVHALGNFRFPEELGGADPEDLSELDPHIAPHSCPPYPEASRSQCIACGHLQDSPGRCEQCGCLSLDEGFFH